MAERRGEAGLGAARHAVRPEASPAADRQRIILLECRIDELRSQLEAARAEADQARTRLAEAAAREADHAARFSQAYADLADARAEAAVLHRQLDHSEALRAELEGHLLDAGPRDDARELLALRREAIAERQRATLAEQSAARLRARAEELLASRETLFARLAEWQELVREDGFESADLSGYLAELRREIMDLERDRAEREEREAALRDRLARVGVDPDAEPVDGVDRQLPALTPLPEAEIETADETPSHDVAAANVAGGEPEPAVAPDVQASAAEPAAPALAAATAPAAEEERPAEREPRREKLPAAPQPASATDPVAAALAAGDVAALRAALLRPGRRDRGEIVTLLREGAGSPDPSMRAAVYEALRKLLDADPPALEKHLRAGLADPDPRVRRRVVLAAATVRGVPLRELLEPLRTDRDAQVQRVVRETLRHAPPTAAPAARADKEIVLTGTDPKP